MVAYARPDADITTTGVGGGTYASLANDADFIYGNENAAVTYECSLTNVSDPASAADHTVRYRVAKLNGTSLDGGGNAVYATVSLYEGASLIAADTQRTCDGSWTTYELDLSEAQANSITDYTALRIRLVSPASGGSAASRRAVGLSWAEFECPNATVTGSVAFAGTGTAAGASKLTVFGAGAASGAGTLTGAALLIVPGAGALSGVGLLVGAADVLPPGGATVEGAATLTGSGALAGAGLVLVLGAGTLAGAGTLDGAAFVRVRGAGGHSVIGALEAEGMVTVYAASLLSATGALAGAGQLIIPASSTLSGTALLAGTPLLFVIASATMTGTGALVASGHVMGATPAENTFTVAVESREMAVLAESRTLMVPPTD